jgi:hypothetical protein
MEPGTVGIPGEYYLTYFGRQTPTNWPFRIFRSNVTDGMKFTVEVIDVWEMTITPVAGEFVAKKQDRYHFTAEQSRSVPLPGKAGIAVRVQRIGGKTAAPETTKAIEAY